MDRWQNFFNSRTLGRALCLIGFLSPSLATHSSCQEPSHPIVYVKHLEPPLRYPPVARATRIQGIVTLRLKVSPEGNVLSIATEQASTPTKGHPLLVSNAQEYVKKWTFGCVNCLPNEPYETTIEFRFQIRNGDGVPYDDSTVVMELPESVIITVSPRECDHCPGEKPEWCKALPRPEYRTLERVAVSDPWFEVYKVAADTYAIYEPHQSEETIAYLILGKQKAILFDTGMGISDIKKVVDELTTPGGVKPPLPIIVLNSHTHDDHVGGNWQFKTIYSMDTKFSRQNAKGSVEDAQAEIAPGEICGDLPKGFDPKTYRTRPWKISKYIGDGETIDLGGRVVQVLATPGHTPDAITLYDRANGLLFTGDTYYPATIWLYRPETNLDQYANSIQQLAILTQMEPSIKLVLGAHNIPVAPPSVLPELVQAFADLRAGKATCNPDKPGRQVCTVGKFSFLVRAQ